MNSSKLVSAAETLVRDSNEHCLVITISNDRLQCVGDSSWVRKIKENPELWEMLSTTLATSDDDSLPLVPKVFPEKLPNLFETPGSELWKGSKIRSQLSTYLAFLGFGHKEKKRYGQGNPPEGWPTCVNWSEFKGPSKGCSLALCTEIICQLLEYQGIDPKAHGPVVDENNPVVDEIAETVEHIEEVDVENIEEVEVEDNEAEVIAKQDENKGRKRRKEKEETESTTKRKKKINEMLARQAWEEKNVPAFQRRRQNMEELAKKLQEVKETMEIEDGELIE